MAKATVESTLAKMADVLQTLAIGQQTITARLDDLEADESSPSVHRAANVATPTKRTRIVGFEADPEIGALIGQFSQANKPKRILKYAEFGRAAILAYMHGGSIGDKTLSPPTVAWTDGKLHRVGENSLARQMCDRILVLMGAGGRPVAQRRAAPAANVATPQAGKRGRGRKMPAADASLATWKAFVIATQPGVANLSRPALASRTWRAREKAAGRDPYRDRSEDAS